MRNGIESEALSILTISLPRFLRVYLYTIAILRHKCRYTRPPTRFSHAADWSRRRRNRGFPADRRAMRRYHARIGCFFFFLRIARALKRVGAARRFTNCTAAREGRAADCVSNILDPGGQIEEKINAGIRCWSCLVGASSLGVGFHSPDSNSAIMSIKVERYVYSPDRGGRGERGEWKFYKAFYNVQAEMCYHHCGTARSIQVAQFCKSF